MPSSGYVGSGMVLTYGGSDFSSYLRVQQPAEDAALFDASAGNIVARDYLPQRADGKMSIEYVEPSGAAGVALWAAVKPAGYGDTPGTLTWGEQGSASGKPKHYIPAYVLSRKRDVVYDDIVVCTVEFQFTGGGRVTDTSW